MVARSAAGLSTSPTSAQLADLEDRRFSLRNRIKAFCKTMFDVLPEARDASDVPNADGDPKPEDHPLPIPSSLPKAVANETVHYRLAEMERLIRFSQANDALASLRRSLALLGDIRQFKQHRVTGQHAQTRAYAQVMRAQELIDLYAARYRRARSAYVALGGAIDDKSELKELRKEDVRVLTSPQSESMMTLDQLGEGYRQVSWIYLAPSSTNTNSPEYLEGTCLYYSSLA
jgi:hypothetical protein